MRSVLALCGRTLVAFKRNKGMLLAGAIAYNGLLSLLPLIAVIFALCSLVFDRQLLLSILSDELSILIPGSVGLTGEVDSLWENRDLIGGIGAAVLLLFSTFAFRAIEDSFAVIFHSADGHRRAWVSALLPLLFVLLIMTGLVLITTITMLLETASTRGLQMLGRHWTIPDATGAVLHYGGTAGLAVLFAAIYWIMPTVKVPVRHALVGGLTAAMLWELVRRTMVWYFANISIVNTIYGSAAAIVVLLLSFEAAAIILLLGAQVIAELGQDSRRSPSTSNR
jgi:YihY family inner membrane protein